MSFFKKFFSRDKNNKSEMSAAAPQLPEKKISTIFPYLKFSGNADVTIGDVFKIDDEAPIIATSSFTTADGKEQQLEIICKKILPDCFLFYGFDLDTMFVQVMPTDFNDSLRLDNLHQVAKENLTYFVENERKPEIRSSETGIHMIVCGGNYEASLILFPDTWTDMQEQLGGPIYVAVAARDMLLFTSKDNLVAIDQIRQLVKEHYHSYPKPMSKYLYKVEGDVWTVAEKMVD